MNTQPQSAQCCPKFDPAPWEWYTTCPKCAEVYGKNYTVLFGQLD